MRQAVICYECILLSFKITLCISETRSISQQGSSRGSEIAITCTLHPPLRQLGIAMLLAVMTQACKHEKLLVEQWRIITDMRTCERAARLGGHVNACLNTF